MPNIAPPPSVASATRLRRSATALVRAGAWLTLAGFGLLLITWLTLYWVILPDIGRWRPLIETKTSAALGVPVRIGSIQVRSSGWVPSVELRDVTLLDAQLLPALHLSRVVASVSARSMLASATSFELRLAQLLVEGAVLDVRRDATGRLFIAGIEVSAPSGESEPAAVDWLLRQREIAIRNASLRWTDEQRGAPPLALTAVDLVVRSTLRRHAMRLDATPAASWGDRFSLRAAFTQPLLARSGDWTRWSGEAYVDAPRADASQLGQYLDLPFQLNQGSGAARAWIGLREGVASGFTLDLALRQVAMRLAPELEPLLVERLQGRLSGQRRASGGSLSLRQFEFVTGEGVHWPPGDIELGWKRGAGGTISGGEFRAGRLDLAVLAHTAERLPLGEAVRKLLAEYNPRGIASEVRAGWDGPLDAPVHYRVNAHVGDLAIDPNPAAEGGAIGRPGVHGAAIELQATETGGEATFAVKEGALELPGVFEDPVVPLTELKAALRWRVEPRAGGEPELQVKLSDARLSNPDAQAELQATWRTGPGEGFGRGGRFPGVLELDGSLTKGVAARTARYLPLALPEGARSYVKRAVRGGNLTRASFRVHGDLWDFPFLPGAPGEFRVAAVAEDVTLAYVPGSANGAPGTEGLAGEEALSESRWPPVTKLSGELVIDRTSLQFRNAMGQVLGVELDSARGGIGNLAEKSVLTLDAQGHGPLSDVLRFVNATPVGEAIHGALRESTASGSAKLKLALALPLDNPSKSTVNGSLQFADNDLRVRRELPLLSAARGRVEFTHKGFAIVGASARVLGGEAVIEGDTLPDGSLRLAAQGSVSAEAMRRAPELGVLAQLAQSLSGQTRYRLSLGINNGLPTIDLTSDLVGLASDLPPPLRKTAGAALPLRWQTTLAPRAAGPPLDVLRVELGSVVRAEFQRDLSGDEPRVLRGGIGVFEPAPTPPSGVAAAVNLASLDVDAWGAEFGRLSGPGAAQGTRSEVMPQSGYAPTQIGLKVQELRIAGRTMTHVAAGLSRRDDQWRANIGADQLAGYVEYRPPVAGDESNPGRVFARLARLSLPRNDAEEVTNLLDRQPANVPALDIVIDELELRGRSLGRIEVQAVNRLAPEREWELTRLTLNVPEAQLSASGRWSASDEAVGARASATLRRKADLRFQLDVTDSGALLKRLGTADAIRGGKGRLKGQIAWFGSPLALDFPSMSGQFNVAIEKGQFLQAQPGAARLLGVLSLQSLARRLTLDFRDVFEEGFVFDSVTGDVAIARGVASTNNLLMRGAQAVVLMEGSADIERETQDLRVVVVPEINAGAASLAYAVINPAIGLGTFLAQLLLREPIIQASTREFHVTGPWADPQVEPVARESGQLVPRIEPPAQAAPGTSPLR